ncbi:hypothetical protein ACJ5H2_01910 [Nocardioides sp. R1-1]|uniref:hypothetical protein n=1 Tax=Nocardioides sp. R1-1 TaxID=3383502 RepID=UPI0038D2578C
MTATALPDGAKVLHIGMPKTGTTAVQHALWRAREQLAAHGVHNVSRGPHERDVALTAVGSAREHHQPRPERWAALAADFRTSTARRTVWSSEALSLASAERVAHLRAELGPAYVVTTLRALAPQLASRWQQGVRRGATVPLDDWLHDRLGDPGEEPDFERPHVRGDAVRRSDPRRVVHAWGRAFGEDRLVFVVLDPTDRDALLRRFEALLGVPRLLEPVPSTNASLPWPEAEALRHLARAFHDSGGERRDWMATIGDPGRTSLQEVVDAAPRSPIPVPRWAAERANEHTAAWVAGLRASGATIVGDVAHLFVDAEGRPEELEPPTRVDVASAGRLMDACFRAALARPAASPARPPDLSAVGGRALVRELGRRAIARGRASRRSG